MIISEKTCKVYAMENLITKTTEWALQIVAQYVKPADTVVDATAGNGHDTLRLCQLVGTEGKVYAFDIQKAALEKTEQLLTEHQIGREQVCLICDSHHRMEEYVPKQEEVVAVLFNLGYLPSGGKQITTHTETTLEAVKTALGRIKPGGLVSLVLYDGHEEGRREKTCLLEMAETLDSSVYHVAYIRMLNQKKAPPEIILITKK